MTEHLVMNYIDGRKVHAIDRKTFENINPATGAVIGECPRSQLEDADAAVLSSERAYKVWSKTPLAERSAVLEKAASLIESRLEEFARAESRDTGKPIAVSMAVDIPRSVANLRFSPARYGMTKLAVMRWMMHLTTRRGLRWGSSPW